MRGRGSALLDILSLPRIDRDPDAPDLLSIRLTELLTHLQAVAQISSESPGIYSSTESGLTSRGTAQDTSSTSVSSSVNPVGVAVKIDTRWPVPFVEEILSTEAPSGGS